MTENINDLRARLAAAEAAEAQAAQEQAQRDRDAEEAHARNVIDRWPQLDLMLREEADRIAAEQMEAARAFDLHLYLQKRAEWIANRYTQQGIRDAFNGAIVRVETHHEPKPDLRHIPQEGAVGDFIIAAFESAGAVGLDRAEELLAPPEREG